MLITIDGPAGVGKGTIAQMLARHFGFVYLDMGLLFRQMAYVLLTQNVSLEDVAAVEHAVSDFNPTLAVDEHLLRTDDVSQAASKISVYDFFFQLVVLQKYPIFISISLNNLSRPIPLS